MDQATVEWLADSRGNQIIGCTKEGKVVYKSDPVKKAWEHDVRGVALRAKYFIGVWAEAQKYRAAIDAGDPKAFGGKACKDRDLESAASQVAYFKAKATEAIGYI